MRLALLIALLLSPVLAQADPVTAAVAAVAAWASVTAATVYLVAATVILSTGMAVYGSAQARRAERDAHNAANAAMQDRMATRIATESPHRYIYGRARVGSDIVAMFTSGDKDQYKHIVCVLAAHECDAIEEVYVNDIAIGALNGSGDVTTGRYARDSYTETAEEVHTGPSFTLDRVPLAGTVAVIEGDGSKMVLLDGVTVSGRNVTIPSSAEVIVTYEFAFGQRFGESIPNSQAALITPYVRVQKHLGGATDPADAYLMSVVPGKWASTAVLRGLCYLVVTLDLNNPEFQNGQVPIQALVRGRKLYDPRSGLTAWSANPALAIYDYLTSKLCSVPASDLPVAQFITAANVCDETSVAGGRYTINGAVTSDQNQSSVLEAMAQCMAGGIVSTSWDIYAGKYVAPIAMLSQSDIVGSISITPGASDAAIYNGVKGQYLSDENDYVLTDFKPYQNDAYREVDGRDLYTNIDFPFTNSLQRVTNLARIFTEDQRNGFTLKAEFSLKAWPYKVGQRIAFTSPFLGQAGKVYRITDKSYAPNSAVQMTLKEDDASIWDFADAVTVDSTPNTNLPDPWAIAPLAGLSCTSGDATLLTQADGTMVPRILASWPVATTQAVFTNGQIEIEWRAVSTSTWSKLIVSGDETQAYLSPITPGWFYIVRARCVNPYLNTKSDWISNAYQVTVFSAEPTVYQWAASQPAAPVGGGSYNWSSHAFGAAPAGWSLTQPAAPGAGGQSLWSAKVLVTDLSSAGVTAFSWSGADIASIGYAPAAGASSSRAAMAYLYKWSTAVPANPTGTSTFTWASGANAGYTDGDGWSVAVPSNPGTPQARLYVASVAVSATAVTTTSVVSYGSANVAAWSANGLNGLQAGSARVYQWAATIPSGPVGAATYTWATGGFGSGPAGGWTLTPGAGSPGYTLWAATVAVSDTSANATTNFSWTTAGIAPIGYAGTAGPTGAAGPAGSNGAAGSSGTSGTSYVTAYCASATATTTTAPAATTGITSLPATNSGGIVGTYSATVPSLVSGQYMYQVDGIYNPVNNQVTWSVPYWSSLKVASLSAITANLGSINAGDINIGSGRFVVDASGNVTINSSTVGVGSGMTLTSEKIVINDNIGALRMKMGKLT